MHVIFGNLVPISPLSKEIILPWKWASSDVKSSDKRVIMSFALYFASNILSTWVLYLCICQLVYPLLLESLPFWCFSSSFWMGRTDRKLCGPVPQKASLFLYTCKSVYLTDKGRYLELLTVLLPWWERLISLYPANILTDCVLPQTSCKKPLCKKEGGIFQSHFLGTDFNASCFPNWECNKKKPQERCSL